MFFRLYGLYIDPGNSGQPEENSKTNRARNGQKTWIFTDHKVYSANKLNSHICISTHRVLPTTIQDSSRYKQHGLNLGSYMNSWPNFHSCLFGFLWNLEDQSKKLMHGHNPKACIAYIWQNPEVTFEFGANQSKIKSFCLFWMWVVLFCFPYCAFILNSLWRGDFARINSKTKVFTCSFPY